MVARLQNGPWRVRLGVAGWICGCVSFLLSLVPAGAEGQSASGALGDLLEGQAIVQPIQADPRRVEFQLGDAPASIQEGVPAANSPAVSGGDGVGADPSASEADAQKQEEAKAKAKKEKADKLKKAYQGAYKPLFFDNDFAYLCDPEWTTCWIGDRLKRLDFGCRSGVDIGGEYRFRLHHERNMRGTTLSGLDDDFGLHRTRIFANARFGSNIRAYAEFIDAESNWENFASRGIEVNRADWQNLFVEALLWEDGTRKFSTRIGRQELLMGDQRLVSPLDWANTRRTFEGIDLIWKSGDWKVDGFWTNPVVVSPHAFDSVDQNQEFMGIYSTYSGVKDQPWDVYVLRHLNGAAGASFEYNTLGTRRTGKLRCWQTLSELAYQSGENNDGSDHAAGMVTLGMGRKFCEGGPQPTLWCYYDYASGDSDRGAGHGFHHHFPLGHKYLGFMDLFGRRNLEDFNFTYSWKPAEKLQILIWYHYLTLASGSDTPYTVGMAAVNGGNDPASTRLGQELDLLATWTFHPRQDLVIGYSHFFAGEYYSATPGLPYREDADFFYTQYSIRF